MSDENIKNESPENENKTQAPGSDESQEQQIDEEAKKKEEHLANLNRALEEAQTELKRVRAEKKKLKSEDEEELPRIDFEDPSSRAWDKHFNEKVNPIAVELEQEKEEVRNFSLKEFLADKPALAAKPEKVKELMSTYERLRTNTERTKEGVLLDLDRAYAATFHQELLQAARQKKEEGIKTDILFSDIAVSRGATTYPESRETTPKLSDEDKSILAKWGMTEGDWIKMKKETGKK